MQCVNNNSYNFIHSPRYRVDLETGFDESPSIRIKTGYPRAYIQQTRNVDGINTDHERFP